MKKEIKFWIFVFIFFVGIAFGVWYSARCVYDGIEEERETAYNGRLTSKVVLEIGQKVNVTLSDDVSKDFYVLSSESDKATLIAVDSIGEAQFNPYPKGNVFLESDIYGQLLRLTEGWTNINTVRLVTIEELRDTGLIEGKVDCKNEENCTSYKYDHVKKDSWLYTTYEYWTGSRYLVGSDATNSKYVYVVTAEGNNVKSGLVGYPKDDSRGTVMRGIRPVIEISKEFIN